MIEHIFLAELKPGKHDIDPSMLMVKNHAKRGRFLCFRTEAAGKITQTLAAQSIIVDHRGDRLRIGFGIYHDESHAQKLARALRR
jgi:selenocysteine lyase/cysteine desulfurase